MLYSVPAAQLDNASDAAAPDYIGDATYSPDDNKLRLYPLARLDTATYERVKAMGFKWAPRQQIFVAPMWTPARADLLTELCGDIGDEDKTLTDRAEERADRFDEYREKRTADAAAAQQTVSRIADGIPMGQPILVGHHSERRARKDKERIDSGMRKAVKMWETAQYWKSRAAGALAHAKYKELPAVRHRRIKGIEADKRKAEKNRKACVDRLAAWTAPGLTLEGARQLANVTGGGHYCIKREPAVAYQQWWNAYDVLQPDDKRAEGCPTLSPEQVAAIATERYPRSIAHYDRWISHYDNRLAYERAMLNEQIGVEGDAPGGMAARFDFKAGGRVLVGRYGGGEWLVILRINKISGVVNSVTTTAPSGVTWSTQWKYGVEQVQDYKAPSDEDSAKAAKATKLPPLVNFNGESFLVMTSDQWKRAQRSGSACVKVAKATAEHGAYRFRESWVPGGSYKRAQVYISDEKTKERPAPTQGEPVTFTREVESPRAGITAPAIDKREEEPDDSAFRAMQQQLKKGGVVVAVAPQLFPTPRELASRMVAMVGGVVIAAGARILEPSAGTGNLVRAVWSHATGADCCRVVMVERDHRLADGLREMRNRTVYANSSNARVVCADFLEIDGPDALAGNDPGLDAAPLGLFDLVLMNPPFENGADIKHIRHAMTFLKPGGKLVAICANGPRQRDQLMSIATHWEDLPAGTFKEAGTNVSTALVVIDRGEA